MNSQHLKNSRIAFCAYCVNVERDTFYPPHNNIAEVETGIRRIVSLTPVLLHCTLLSFSNINAAANPRSYFLLSMQITPHSVRSQALNLYSVSWITPMRSRSPLNRIAADRKRKPTWLAIERARVELAGACRYSIGCDLPSPSQFWR